MIRRFRDFELTLNLRRDDFIDCPRAEQRSWVVSRAVDELVDELRHLDLESESFIQGATRSEVAGADWSQSTADLREHELIIENQQVMQDWEVPLMHRLAEIAGSRGGHVLEIGYGMGISAGFLQEQDILSHTIIELNEQVARASRDWAQHGARVPTHIVDGSWHEQLPSLGMFDGILWDAFPTSEREFDNYVINDSSVAETFFSSAADHLVEGGVFTYYSNERDSLSRRHQRALLRYFRSCRVEVVSGLRPPDDCEYWWAPQMAVVTAER
jgi:putative multi-domain non-ribosomal peptide synthetase